MREILNIHFHSIHWNLARAALAEFFGFTLEGTYDPSHILPETVPACEFQEIIEKVQILGAITGSWCLPNRPVHGPCPRGRYSARGSGRGGRRVRGRKVDTEWKTVRSTELRSTEWASTEYGVMSTEWRVVTHRKRTPYFVHGNASVLRTRYSVTRPSPCLPQPIRPDTISPVNFRILLRTPYSVLVLRTRPSPCLPQPIRPDTISPVNFRFYSVLRTPY